MNIAKFRRLWDIAHFTGHLRPDVQPDIVAEGETLAVARDCGTAAWRLVKPTRRV